MYLILGRFNIVFGRNRQEIARSKVFDRHFETAQIITLTLILNNRTALIKICTNY